MVLDNPGWIGFTRVLRQWSRKILNHSGAMPLIDFHAAQLLTEMREERGLSPEALAQQIAVRRDIAGLPTGRGTVDAHTIRRIERHGHVPGPRVAFVLAAFFGMRPNELWRPVHRRKAIAA